MNRAMARAAAAVLKRRPLFLRVIDPASDIL
jgi:hypothetical protein